MDLAMGKVMELWWEGFHPYSLYMRTRVCCFLWETYVAFFVRAPRIKTDDHLLAARVSDARLCPPPPSSQASFRHTAATRQWMVAPAISYDTWVAAKVEAAADLHVLVPSVLHLRAGGLWGVQIRDIVVSLPPTKLSTHKFPYGSQKGWEFQKVFFSPHVGFGRWDTRIWGTGREVMHEDGGGQRVLARSSPWPSEHMSLDQIFAVVPATLQQSATMLQHNACGISAGGGGRLRVVSPSFSFQHRFTIVSPLFHHRFTFWGRCYCTSLHHRFTMASSSFHHRCVVGNIHLHPQVSKSAWGEAEISGRSRPGLQKTMEGLAGL